MFLFTSTLQCGPPAILCLANAELKLYQDCTWQSWAWSIRLSHPASIPPAFKLLVSVYAVPNPIQGTSLLLRRDRSRSFKRSQLTTLAPITSLCDLVSHATYLPFLLYLACQLLAQGLHAYSAFAKHSRT